MSDKDKVSVFAVDVGYSHVKAASDDGRRISFPSLVVSHVDTGVSLDMPLEVVNWVGRNVVVGNPDEGGRLASLDGFHGSFEWQALMCKTFFLLMKEMDVTTLSLPLLVVGLPLSQNSESRKAKVKAVKRYQFTVDDVPYLVNIGAIEVIPQGAAMLMRCPADDDGIGIIDIGHYTVDLAVMRKGVDGIPRIINSRTKSLRTGMHTVFKQLDSLLSARIGKSDVDFGQAFKILKNKRIKYQGNTEDLSVEIDSILSEYVNAIVKQVGDAWGDDIDFLSRIVVSGGGAVLLRDLFPDRFEMADDSFFGNAIGYLEYGEFWIRKNRG